MPATPRVLNFDVSVDRDGTAASGVDASELEREGGWSAEHFVLAGLVRCTLASLAHAAKRAEVDVVGRGHAHGRVTKRETDGLYAFVEIETSYDVEVSPPLEPAALADLLARAERGCFVGNSLTARPSYRWTVNGAEVS